MSNAHLTPRATFKLSAREVARLIRRESNFLDEYAEACGVKLMHSTPERVEEVYREACRLVLATMDAALKEGNHGFAWWLWRENGENILMRDLLKNASPPIQRLAKLHSDTAREGDPMFGW